jgi:hypothetical protein
MDRILAVVEAYFGHLAEHPDIPHLLLQEVASGREPPPTVLEIVGEVKNTIAGLHQEAVAAGIAREGHPALMALSVASQPLYLTVVAPMMRAVTGIDLSDPTDRRMVIQHVSEFVRRGLESRPEEAP